ncbi:hypothetical protein OAI06_00120 [Schleiferiaceae bacterium]|jgi:hypothetical protein|nr:hypothetical protein [Schleiferiaceae bacterium]
MKLLTTIAAVLISISVFSQDLIVYNEGTYSLNGEEVSLEYKKSMTDFNPDAESMFEFSLGGTFSRNGEELSMEQIYDLTVLHKAGKGNVRRGVNFDEMHKNPYLRGNNNIGYLAGGALTGFFGGIGVLIVSDASGDWRWRDASEKVRYVIAVGATTGLCAVSLKAFSGITLSKKGCLRKRDKQFNKVADKLNEAIQSSNQ